MYDDQGITRQMSNTSQEKCIFHYTKYISLIFLHFLRIFAQIVSVCALQTEFENDTTYMSSLWLKYCFVEFLKCTFSFTVL